MGGCQPPSYRTGAERVSEKNSYRKLAEQCSRAASPSVTTRRLSARVVLCSKRAYTKNLLHRTGTGWASANSSSRKLVFIHPHRDTGLLTLWKVSGSMTRISAYTL